MTPEEIQKLQLSHHLLLELLANIHSDGGHYVAIHGVEDAVAVAQETVISMRGFAEGNNNYRVFYESLVSKIVGDYGKIASVNGPIIAGDIAAAKVQEAFDTLRTVRATLQMRLGRGVEPKDIPEVGGTTEGLVRAIENVATQGQKQGRDYERALIASWLSHNPTDANMELAFAGENPYLWLVHAIHAKRHEEAEDVFPF
jgi:hypothetical protein